MGVGDVGERREHLRDRPGRPELGAGDQRLARRWAQRAGARRVDPGRGAASSPVRLAPGLLAPQPAASAARRAEQLTSASRRVIRLTSPPARRSRSRAWPAAVTHSDRDERRRAQARRGRARSRCRGRAQRQRRVARGEPRQRRPEHEALEQRSRSPPPAPPARATAPASRRPTAAAPAPNARSTDDRAPALLDGQRARLDQRVQADQPVDDRRSRAGSCAAPRRAATPRPPRRRLAGAALGPSAALTAPAFAPGFSRTASCSTARRGIGGQQRGGRDVGDPAVVVERADHARDAQAQLAAPRGAAMRQRRARGEAERLGQARARPRPARVRAAGCPTRQRRRLEDRVVAGIGDHVDRLPERERVDGLGLVARRRGLDAGDRAHARRRRPAGAVGGQLVALAERARVGLERR